MDSFEKVYENIKHLITIQENRDIIRIDCLRNDLIYSIISNKSNYIKDHYYKDPFKEIISEFKDDKIKIKYNSNEQELKMIIDHILTIKNINSFRKPEQNKNLIEKKIKINNLEFHVILENKNIYIEVLTNQKTYTFIIGNGDLNAHSFDELCELIEDKKVTFFEKNNDFYLEIKHNFSFPLKYCIEKTNINDINKLNNFMNLFNEDGDNKYNGDIKISKYIKDINSKNNKILKRMENIITEIKVKKEQINKDNAAMGNNIITMDENADIMIFPKIRFPLSKTDKGIKLDSYIIGKIDDFNLINNKLTQIYDEEELNYSLIYRASRDRDLAKIFKEKCKYIRGTLIIVKTDEKKIFGGFTTQIWDDSERNYDDDKAFCFSLNKKKIYELKPYCSAIGCDKGSGPRFNYMFMIYNKFFLKGGILFREEISHYNGQKEDFELTDGEENFLVEELEVFKITRN